MRPCIPLGGVAKARNIPDIPALSRLANRVPEHLKSVNLFLLEPLTGRNERSRGMRQEKDMRQDIGDGIGRNR